MTCGCRMLQLLASGICEDNLQTSSHAPCCAHSRPIPAPRYEREFNRGHRPLLKAVLQARCAGWSGCWVLARKSSGLACARWVAVWQPRLPLTRSAPRPALPQHDEMPSAAMVLMVASVHLPPPGATVPGPPAGPGGAGGAPQPAGVTVRARAACLLRCKSAGSGWPHISPSCPCHPCPSLQLELTDGWYWVRASCDERLTRLAAAGRIGQGDKLRICGAELASPGPGEPLDAAATGAAAERPRCAACCQPAPVQHQTLLRRCPLPPCPQPC